MPGEYQESHHHYHMGMPSQHSHAPSLQGTPPYEGLPDPIEEHKRATQHLADKLHHHAEALKEVYGRSSGIVFGQFDF
jgi:hypothetical protein